MWSPKFETESDIKDTGDSRVFCRGRFVTGPDGRACLFTASIVIVPSVVWQVFVGTFWFERFGAALPVVNAILLVLSIWFLAASALSDPGILPRQKDFAQCLDSLSGELRIKQPARYFDIVLRGHALKLKYCTTCNLYRPPRCSHCSVCEVCVERFDHHCPWLGNCIGRRNYWKFVCFVSITACLNVFSLATSCFHLAYIWEIIGQRDQVRGFDLFSVIVGQAPISFGLTVYCSLIIWFTVGLSCFHVYLIGRNETTYEHFKAAYASGANPFDQGTKQNCKDVLCFPIRQRYFDRNGKSHWPSLKNQECRDWSRDEDGSQKNENDVGPPTVVGMPSSPRCTYSIEEPAEELPCSTLHHL